MSRFHQRLREDLRDPEFAEAFYDMSVDIALLQVLEQARKALNVSEKELAERMGVQRTTVTRLFNASHPRGTTYHRDTSVQRFSPKPYSGYHLRYTPCARASGRDQNQPSIPGGCTYSY